MFICVPSSRTATNQDVAVDQAAGLIQTSPSPDWEMLKMQRHLTTAKVNQEPGTVHDNGYRHYAASWASMKIPSWTDWTTVLHSEDLMLHVHWADATCHPVERLTDFALRIYEGTRRLTDLR